jgi:hypothetical protein
MGQTMERLTITYPRALLEFGAGDLSVVITTTQFELETAERLLAAAGRSDKVWNKLLPCWLPSASQFHKRATKGKTRPSSGKNIGNQVVAKKAEGLQQCFGGNRESWPFKFPILGRRAGRLSAERSTISHFAHRFD